MWTNMILHKYKICNKSVKQMEVIKKGHNDDVPRGVLDCSWGGELLGLPSSYFPLGVDTFIPFGLFNSSSYPWSNPTISGVLPSEEC